MSEQKSLCNGLLHNFTEAKRPEKPVQSSRIVQEPLAQSEDLETAARTLCQLQIELCSGPLHNFPSAKRP